MCAAALGFLLLVALVVAVIIGARPSLEAGELLEPSYPGRRRFLLAASQADEAEAAINHPIIPSVLSTHPADEQLRVCAVSATQQEDGYWLVVVEYAPQPQHEGV